MHTCTSDVVLAPSLYFGAPVFGAAGGGGGGGGGICPPATSLLFTAQFLVFKAAMPFVSLTFTLWKNKGLLFDNVHSQS